MRVCHGGRSSVFSGPRARRSPSSPSGGGSGELLVEAGRARRRAAGRRRWSSRRRQDQRLGRILVANGLISRDDLGAALSRQSGLGRIDLAASPADPELVRGIDPYRCLELEAVPWRQIGGTRVVAIANPDNAEAAMAACGGAAARVALALAAPEEIRRAITEAFVGRLRDDARETLPGGLQLPRLGAGRGRRRRWRRWRRRSSRRWRRRRCWRCSSSWAGSCSPTP